MINTNELDEFKSLLKSACNLIASKAEENPNEFLEKNSSDFEKIVSDALTEMAKGTLFDNTIELISGHAFPDIIVKDIYGVEVKTVRQNKWETAGNSIFETTRKKNVEYIFIFFAKLYGKVPEFKCKLYQECLSKVAVTHSPRYIINMDLKNGDSIFDKIKLDYDDIRKQENPAKPFIDYYKKLAKPSEESWWMGSEQETDLSPMIIRLFENLNKEEQRKLIIDSFILFPEILSNKRTKYKRAAIWLANRHSIVSPSLRDKFTADSESKVYKAKSKIFTTLQKYKEDIFERIKTISIDDLKYYWKKTFDDKKTILDQWRELCIKNCKLEDEVFVRKMLQ